MLLASFTKTVTKRRFNCLFVSALFQYHSEDSTLGVEYFEGSMFGYTIYIMFGLFIIALAVGLSWQYFPLAKKEQKFETGTGKYN